MAVRPIHWLTRIVLGRPRLFAALLCGLASMLVLPHTLRGVTRAVLVWDIGVLVYLTLALHLFVTERIENMPVHAKRQQEGEWTIFWLTVGAIAFSFAAILGEFSNTKDMTGPDKGLHVALVAGTLFLTWLMTHTSFAFRYAHEYYSMDRGRPDVDGGLQFPGEDRPDYLDFFYFALVLGMTFQVSDVQITSRPLRRLASVHGLLGFLFNTIILALTVNIAAGTL